MWQVRHPEGDGAPLGGEQVSDLRRMLPSGLAGREGAASCIRFLASKLGAKLPDPYTCNVLTGSWEMANLREKARFHKVP